MSETALTLISVVKGRSAGRTAAATAATTTGTSGRGMPRSIQTSSAMMNSGAR